MATVKKKKNSRRGNNEGSVFQRADGRWCAVVNIGYDRDGRRMRKTFYGKTRAEVAVKMTAELGERLKGGHASPSNDSLQVLMHEWLMTFKRADVSPRTFERNLGTAKLHIYPHIGALRLHEITPNIVQSLFNRMLFGGYAPASVRKVKFLLHQFFAYAKNNRFVSENPVDGCIVKTSKEHKEQKEEKYKAIPIELREIFLDAVSKDPFLKPLCMIQMFAGLRIGEALALQWKDVDLAHGVINIDNAVTVVPTLDRQGNTISKQTVISDTKTVASVREVPMPEILKQALLEWNKLRRKQQIDSGFSLTAPDDLVFGTNQGKLRTYYGTKTMFERLMRHAGLAEYKIHFHSLRHTYSSMLFEEKENPKVIQMLLGHKDVTTTIKTYNSVDRSYFKQATDKLDEKFRPREDK